jgi:hypothetical protein
MTGARRGVKILPRRGEVATKATKGEDGDTASIVQLPAPSVTLRVPPPPWRGGIYEVPHRLIVGGTGVASP